MAKKMTIDEQIRREIERLQKKGVTAYRIAKESGMTQPTLSRFLTRRRDLTLTSVQPLLDYLGLALVRRK